MSFRNQKIPKTVAFECNTLTLMDSFLVERQSRIDDWRQRNNFYGKVAFGSERIDNAGSFSAWEKLQNLFFNIFYVMINM